MQEVKRYKIQQTLTCQFDMYSDEPCTQSRKTQFRMEAIIMGTIPNGHNPEWTQSQMDTIPNGHNSERTPSRMSTYNYIVTLVFHSYCLVRFLLRRRGFKQKLNL